MDEKALKTICGAIHYTLTRYNQNEISTYDWQLLNSYVQDFKPGMVYCVEVFKDGFLLSTRKICIRYFHHVMHGQRMIEIKKMTK